jgi:glycosyltransferase involved in cell wall biosynthesis
VNKADKKLRIILISNNYTPYSGGVVSSINAQIDALQGDQHFVRLITLDFLGNMHDDPAHVIRIQTPIKFRHQQKHYAIPWFMVTQLTRIINNINPDIIHVHHPFLLGVKALDVGRKLGVPVVFTYHTLYEEYAHYVPLPVNLSKMLIGRLVRNFCAKVDAIIVPGQSIANYLIKQRISSRLVCIPSSLQPCYCHFPFRPRIYKLTSPVKLLTVGRFTREKNLQFLLDVCQLLEDRFVLTLAGYGIEYENLRHYAYRHLKLSPKRVQFVLKPLPVQLVNFYKQADLFLFSSTTDTQGLVLAEAMACSTPVIAVHGPGQSDIILDKKNGLLVLTPEEMASSINELVKNPHKLNKMRKQAWLTAKNFMPKTFNERLFATYKGLVDE